MHISDSILGGQRYFFLLTLQNFKNIEGGGGGARAHPTPPAPRSLIKTLIVTVIFMKFSLHVTKTNENRQLYFKIVFLVGMLELKGNTTNASH